MAGETLPPSMHLAVDGPVATLSLARPDKRNALNLAMIDAVRRFFDAPPQGVRAVVLRGEGAHFCAGLDLNEMTAQDATEAVFHSRSWHRAFAAMESGTLPVVSVLRGAVIGGGLELAAATHIRVAEASTFYALPEGSRGIFVGGGGSVRIPRLIGAARMTDMMLTGRTYGAADGEAVGFSQYVVDDGAGDALAQELAAKMAGNAPMTTFAVLQALPAIAGAEPGIGYLAESLVSAVAVSDAEAKRRLADFLEKRAEKVSHK